MMVDSSLNELTHEASLGNAGTWYCIYTKPKQEDIVSAKLQEVPGIEVFNPKLRRKKVVRGRVNEVVEEFFPCYIFSKFDPRKFHHMITYTRGVRRIVGNSLGIPYIVDPAIIALIKSKMKDGYISVAYPKLAQGEEVRIVDGPFKGFTGLFSQELKPSERILVLLNTIRFQAKVEIEADLVTRA